MLSFESDYIQGAHEKILQRLTETNLEPLSGYGNDTYCASAKEKILERYRAGEDLKDVARDLGLGYGEVKLIVELYKGEEDL